MNGQKVVQKRSPITLGKGKRARKDHAVATEGPNVKYLRCTYTRVRGAPSVPGYAWGIREREARMALSCQGHGSQPSMPPEPGLVLLLGTANDGENI